MRQQLHELIVAFTLTAVLILALQVSTVLEGEDGLGAPGFGRYLA